MLDVISTAQARQKLQDLASSVIRDPVSWDGWYALSLVIPLAADPALSRAGLQIVSQDVEHSLSLAEGMITLPDDFSLLVVCRHVGQAHLISAAVCGVDVLCDQTSLTPEYEIYQLSKESEAFFRFLETRFELGQVSRPRPWPSSSLFPATSVQEMLRHQLARSRRVLLVEDDPITRWLVRSALKDECELITAGTVVKAIELYEQTHPDVVFLDINLPDGSGEDVLRWVIQQNAQAQVVMFTHHDNFDSMTQSIAHGAAGFIAKPFHRSRLLHYIQKN